MSWLIGHALGFGGFLKSLPWQTWAALALAIAIVGGWELHVAAVNHAHSVGYVEGVNKTVQKFKDAQALADQRARDAVARDVSIRSGITKDISHDLNSSRDAIDARVAALRVRHARKHPPRPSDLPPISGSASGTDEEAACDGLDWETSVQALKHAAEADDTQNKWVDWAERQMAVKPSRSN